MNKDLFKITVGFPSVCNLFGFGFFFWFGAVCLYSGNNSLEKSVEEHQVTKSSDTSVQWLKTVQFSLY